MAAIGLRIRNESGGISINLVDHPGGTILLEPYQMRAPSSTAPDATVTESVLVRWSSRSSALTNLKGLNLLFEQAKLYQETGLGERVFVEVDTVGTWWRSELRVASNGDAAGRATPGEQALHLDYANSALEVLVSWTRRFYWEGAETEVPLAVLGAAATTGGVSVLNRDDAGGNNWVQLASSSILGDLPAAVRLQVQNWSLDTMSALHVAVQDAGDPETWTHVMEAEAGSGGTTVGDLTSSGAEHRAFSWIEDTERGLWVGDIPSDTLANGGSNFARLMIRLAVTPTTMSGLWLRARILLPSWDALWEGPLVRVDPNRQLVDLGAVRLPPQRLGTTNPATLQVQLQARRTGGGSLAFDYLMFHALTGWRRYIPLVAGKGLESDYTLIDDGLTGLVYSTSPFTMPVGARFFSYTAEGPELLLRPGRISRLYFLCDVVDGSERPAPIGQELRIRMYYRPRRSTL
jgi:hypothetical protein